MSAVSVTPSTPSEEHLLHQLWTMFRHDMSAYTGALPDAEGRFRADRLRAALTEPAWEASVVRLDGEPAGLAIVRAQDQPRRVLSSFFVVRGARRRGVGLAAAATVLRERPGEWDVAYQDANTGAAAFWPRVATAVAGDAWTHEHRDVPGRPELPPDSWITLRVAPAEVVPHG